MCSMWSRKLVAVRAARYLSWSASNSASFHPCPVAVAAIDKAFTDQPSSGPKDAPWVGGVEGTLEDPGGIDGAFFAG